MRTNIVIEDELMAAAMNASGLGTKREVVEAGLKLLVKLKAQENIRRYRGKLAWQGDLKQQRGLR
jgi:Arc/MetJ family transcription regulator